MFKNVLLKDLFREIKGSLNRFLSIFAIVMLGVGFFAGVKSTSPDIKMTADKYFEDYRLNDLHIISTMGFNSDDIKAIKEQKDFNNIMFSYSADAIMNVNNSKVVVRMFAVPDTRGSIGRLLNMPALSSGRLPEKSGECVVENNNIEKQYTFKLGDKITLEPEAGGVELSDLVKKSEYTIVGFVDTPVYVSFMRGASILGDGSVSCYMMIPRDDFNLELYTDAYLTASTASGYSTFEKRYKDEIARLKKPLEDLADSRNGTKYNELKNEITTKISENQSKLDEAKDGLDKLKSSEEDIKLEIHKLQSEEQKLRSQGNDLQSQIQKLKPQISQLNSQANQAQADAKQLQSQVQQAQTQAQQLVNDAKKLEGEAQQLQTEAQRLQTEAQQLQAEAQQLQAEAQQAQAEAQQLQASGDYAGAQAKASEAQARANEAQAKGDEAKKKGAEAQAKGDEAKKKGAVAQVKGDEAKKKGTEAQAKGDEVKKKGAEAKKVTIQAKTAEAQLAAMQEKVPEIEKGIVQLKDTITKLEDQLAEVRDKILETEDKVADGQAKLDDARSELDKLERPKWYVETREDNPGFTELEQSSDRLDAVAYVFPVFFLLVAGLVCLTTMSRMVEEQRAQLGTLKAFGYSDMAIMSKYLVYSGLASLLGSIAGIAVGMRFIPGIIFDAYQDMFTLPQLMNTFQKTSAAASTFVAIACTVCVAFFVCYKELGHDSAALMRPKAPKPGKRIMLEYISFIWSHLSFTSKVTSRNIFRYKARFLMTVMGIAGCGALILSGLGLNNSIKTIAPKQFDEILKYNTIIGLKDEVKSLEGQELRRQLSSEGRLEQSTFVRIAAVDALKDSKKLEVHLYVPEEPSRFKDYFTLRHRTDKAAVTLEGDGIILTEKAANILGISKGDTLELRSNEKTVKVKVSDIVENYVSHNVYMSPGLYAEKFSNNLGFNSVLGKLKDTSETNQKQFARDLLKEDNILTVTFTTNINKNLNDTFHSLDVMVLVMIIAAGALAFVVVYNLTNINITERIREIATIKALGFYNGEVANYIYRENIVLTIIGVALGLFAGIYLHKFIIATSEVDIVMLGRTILTKSFLQAGLLTIIFSLLVNFVMYFKLTGVNMVESFKSVD